MNVAPGNAQERNAEQLAAQRLARALSMLPRKAQANPFVELRRTLLRAPEGPGGRRLCPTDALLLSFVSWCHEGGRSVPGWMFSALTDIPEGTVSKAFARLRKLGWLDAFNRPARALPEQGAEGHLRIYFAAVRELGRPDALTLAQLETLGNIRKARAHDGQVTCARGLVASLTGRSRSGSGASMRRLEVGDVLRVRVLERRAQLSGGKLQPPPRIARIRLRAHESPHEQRLVISLVHERERRKLRDAVYRARAHAQVTADDMAYAQQAEQARLDAERLLREARSGPPRPPPN